jgi:hypothetical protein
MIRYPNDAAVEILSDMLTDYAPDWLRKAFTLGILEADSDLTTAAPEDDDEDDTYPSSRDWIEAYDAGREIARAALGLD